MKIKYDSEKRWKYDFLGFWTLTSLHSSPLFFIVQITANRISEMNFTYFCRFTFVLSYHKNMKSRRWTETYLQLFSQSRDLKIVEAVKNHKVDEWSPLSIREENRINLHLKRAEIFSSPSSSLKYLQANRRTKILLEGKMLNEKNSWYDFPLIIFLSHDVTLKNSESTEHCSGLPITLQMEEWVKTSKSDDFAWKIECFNIMLGSCVVGAAFVDYHVSTKFPILSFISCKRPRKGSWKFNILTIIYSEMVNYTYNMYQNILKSIQYHPIHVQRSRKFSFNVSR